MRAKAHLLENSYLFVYRALRPQSGHEMSRWLVENSHYIGTATLKGQLYQVSYYPALVAGNEWVLAMFMPVR